MARWICSRAEIAEMLLHECIDPEMMSINRAHGVVVSHPLSMREALDSIPSVSICLAGHAPTPRSHLETHCVFERLGEQGERRSRFDGPGACHDERELTAPPRSSARLESRSGAGAVGLAVVAISRHGPCGAEEQRAFVWATMKAAFVCFSTWCVRGARQPAFGVRL